jgi:hypothetical protein
MRWFPPWATSSWRRTKSSARVATCRRIGATAIDAPGNILNKLVLAGLDEAIGKMDPQSHRVHFAVRVPRAAARTARRWMRTALESVVGYLRAMPERADVEPGHRRNAGLPRVGRRRDGAEVPGVRRIHAAALPEPAGPCGMNTDGSTSSAAEDGHDADGETVKANQFVAPYVYLKIWILDRRRSRCRFAGGLRVPEDVGSEGGHVGLERGDSQARARRADRPAGGQATEEAVKRTELRGQVEVKDRGEVKEGAK